MEQKKRGGETDFKMGGGHAGSTGGCLKKGGGLEPHYELWSGTLARNGLRKTRNSTVR